MIKHHVRIEENRLLISADDEKHSSFMRMVIPVDNPQIMTRMIEDLLNHTYASGYRDKSLMVRIKRDLNYA